MVRSLEGFNQSGSINLQIGQYWYCGKNTLTSIRNKKYLNYRQIVEFLSKNVGTIEKLITITKANIVSPLCIFIDFSLRELLDCCQIDSATNCELLVLDSAIDKTLPGQRADDKGG